MMKSQIFGAVLFGAVCFFSGAIAQEAPSDGNVKAPEEKYKEPELTPEQKAEQAEIDRKMAEANKEIREKELDNWSRRFGPASPEFFERMNTYYIISAVDSAKMIEESYQSGETPGWQMAERCDELNERLEEVETFLGNLNKMTVERNSANAMALDRTAEELEAAQRSLKYIIERECWGE